ncbi:TOBE domain-containing protein [Sulfurimonas sp. C5]|uniref:TOBE domain-containing protein n=1 Tax=Sulfurimonas sp. C5 TaxID=3036947 RepID=UPI002454F7C5|nr:TOBE domain-containing protein [Sulfurimonas sp. C5]MDH4944977.1 TOBE domain-containing protein [Sulfurimonas sp. C5]
MKIDGRFWLTKNDKSFLGSGRIELLEKIAQTGSINAAAKEMKMSYKAAWERINSMNELADEPIILRTIGGKGGGGTKLTDYAYELINTYKKLDELHRQFINRFSEAGDNPEHLAQILNRLFLTTSARNQLLATISQITINKINAVISMEIAGGGTLHSSITAKSAESMNLRVGSEVYGIIKSSDIQITTQKPQDTAKTNVIEGVVESIISNETDSEITLQINEKFSLTSSTSNKELQQLKQGDKAFAVIDYANVIIGL